jgi:pimeloyl-ACP methyl ester carboxylesterase
LSTTGQEGHVQEGRGQERWIEADGVRVHAVDHGDGQTRVLLVHGLGAHTLSWEPSAAGLAERLRATVTAVDLPGFGLTRLPRGRNATLGTHGRVLRAVLEQSGPSIVAGNSMGGALGVGLAARHPELVRALVLVDPALPRPAINLAQWSVMARLAPMMVPMVGAQFLAARGRLLGPERMVDDTLGWTVCDPARIDPALRRRLVELAQKRRSFPEATAAYADSARSLFWYLTRRMRADEARVACPTLIVHGDRDRLVPAAAARALAARRPDFALELIDDCGHTPQLEVPEEFLAAAVPWLTATLAAER